MKKVVRALSWTAAVLLVAGVFLAPGDADAQYREFSGEVQKISKNKMIVDNRMGDKVSFNKVDDTVVEGEATSWDEIKKKQWVTVSWKFIDKPRKAYKIVVEPEKEEEGEDVE